MVGYLPITLLHFSVFTLFIRNFAGENVEIHLRMKKTGLGMLLGGLGMLAEIIMVIERPQLISF